MHVLQVQPGRGWILWFSDLANMEAEFAGVIVSNAGSTCLYAQALRLYLHYVFGVDCPTSDYLNVG